MYHKSFIYLFQTHAHNDLMFLSSLAFITWTLNTSQLSCKSVHSPQ